MSRTPHYDHKRIAHSGGRQVEPRERNVRPLQCGHEPVGPPALSNPDRWWCCRAWQPMKAHR
jgi:hypothetical protein